MASHKNDTFSVNHKYVDIKSQKISPEGKAKIQLQIVMHDGACTTFHFNNPSGGADAQKKERDDVKELLQQLLPTFKKKVNKELEEKNRMLSENPGLLQLYKDLVITNIITPDEFWIQHAPKSSSQGGSSSAGSDSATKNQEVGVAGSFMADIKPQADGANGIRYNLTTDIIQSIFKTYPAVKRKHSENVPEKMTEQDFWTKFFQSHYFHRDRLHGKGIKDIFTECAKDDDKRMKEQIRAGVADPVTNITTLSDKTIDESFGADEGIKSSNIVHQSIIKRFNQHSIMVMNAGKDRLIAAPPQDPQEKADLKTKEPIISDEAQKKNVEAKRKRLQNMTEYEDLEEVPAKKAASLNIAKAERYFIGPTPTGSNQEAQFSVHDINQWRQNMHQTVMTIRRDNCKNVLSARNAVSVLNDLSPGGALMKSSTQESLAEQYPPQIHQDLKQLYGSLSELLRHFWACFLPMPPTTPAATEKANKMHDTLRKFEQVKLRPFENELARQYSSGPNITMHIHQMLEAAYRKFTTWQKNASRHVIK